MCPDATPISALGGATLRLDPWPRERRVALVLALAAPARSRPGEFALRLPCEILQDVFAFLTTRVRRHIVVK